MKIEKLAETKLKIIFNSEELEENNITLHSFLSNSLKTQKFFLAILEIANEDLNFNTYNCPITYEAFSFENKTFIIFITKQQNSTQEDSYYSSNNFFPVLKDDIFQKNNRFFFFDNKLSKEKNSYIYAFYSIEELFDFCKILNAYSLPSTIESNLYQYNDIYFLEIKNTSTNLSSLELLDQICSEIKNESNFSEFTKIRLKEFSKLLLETNAISILG